MTNNPFLQIKEEVDRELKIRGARGSYLDYVQYVNANYIASRFHTYLCNEIESFITSPSKFSFDVLLLSVSPQHGKLLSNATPVLTGKGWRTHGELRVGDEVYGLDGELKKVTHVFPKHYANKRVHFTDKSYIDCHDNHDWLLHDTRTHGCRQVKIATKDIEVHTNNNVGSGHRYRYLLPHVKVLNNSKIDLPIDPYFLGIWLGDNTTTKPQITMTESDFNEIKDYLPKHSSYYTQETIGIPTYVFKSYGRKFRKLGIMAKGGECDIRTKHIPDIYFNSSIEQRLELLAGLIDSDGDVDKNGRVAITTSDKLLRDSIIRLISTFNWRTKVVTQQSRTSISGTVSKSEYYVIEFRNYLDIPCKIKRKKDALKSTGVKRRVSICKIEDIKPVEGNCIEVEGGIYLVGDTLKPTHNSITVTETLPSWYLGKNPDKHVIICGYNEDFAIRFGRRNKEKIEEFHSDLFPECKLAKSPNSNVEFETTKKGRCISRGILSGLTGNTADLFIIDDPIKNRQEADSERIRNTIWNEYMNSIISRIKPGGKLIVIQTRWHEEDLFGMIKASNPNAKVINLPCEAEEDNDVIGRMKGDALCPEIGRGNAWLKDFKKSFIGKEGSRAWTALYQGKPTAMSGNLILREWWQYYDDIVVGDLPYVIMSVDTAFKDGDDNDYVAIQVWGKENNNFYLIDALKQHLNFVDTLKAIRSIRSRYPEILFILIEDKANGSAIINVLSQEMTGVIPIEPEGGKVARVNAVSPAIENGRVHLPRFATFTESFVQECSAFPHAKHDDQVDCMSQALNRMLFVDAEVVAPDKIIYNEWSNDMFEDYERASYELQVELLQLWGHPIEWKEGYYE